MKRLPLSRFMLPLALAAAFPGQAVFARQPSKQQSQVRGEIEAALTKPWQITGFERVDSTTPPWSQNLPGVSGGYVISCEDPTQTSAEVRSKDGSNSAARHPGFALWVIDRSASVTPATVHAKLSSVSPMIQMARPVELGSNDQFIVECMDQCSGRQVDAIVAKLKLKPFQPPH